VNSAAIFPPTAIPFNTSPTALNPWNAFGAYSDGTLTVSINATREYKNAKYWNYYSDKVTIDGSKFDTVKLAQITLNSASKVDDDVVSNVSEGSENYLEIKNGSISAVVGDYNAAEGTGLASVEGTKSYVEGRIPDIISGNEKYISVSGVMTEDGNNECKITPNMAESNQYYKKDGLVSLSLSDSIYMSSDATSPHEVEETFTRRAFDGGLTGTDSSATIHKIVGKTVKYNQIADRAAGQSASVNVYDDYNNVIGAIVAGFDAETSEYTLTYSGEKGGKLKSTWRNLLISSIRLKPSHKYAISTDRPYYGVGIVEYDSKDWSSTYHELNAIFTAKGTASIDDGCNVYLALRNNFSVKDEFGTGENLVIRLRINLFDLTEMFGDGAEPGSFAEFRTMYPKPYYQPCIDPIITGVNIKSISIPRYNLFDSNSAVTGVFRYDTGYFKCTPGWENLFCSYIIPVKANIKYSLHNVANRSQVPACVFFDKDMRQLKDSNGKAANNISYGGPQDLNADNTTASGVITTPSGCHFMAIMTRINGKDKTCVSVFSSRNGSYEAFNPITIDLGVVKNYFPYGLLEKGGVFDEVCDGYAIRRINYDEYEDNGVSRISNLRTGGFTINGQKGKAFQYIPLDHPIGMSWRIKRGGTENIDLDDVSAPFKGNIVYSIESYNSLPKPQRILDSDGFLLLGSKVKDETFLSTKLISPIWHTIPNQEDQYIPTSDQVYSAILNMMPTVAAEAMPRKTQDDITFNIDNLSLIANTMIEITGSINKTINVENFEKPLAMGDWNNLDNEWCIRFGCISNLKPIVKFRDGIKVHWKDGYQPTMNAVGGIMELRFRRIHGEYEEYIGSWNRYY
jgi:hypothetical protein